MKKLAVAIIGALSLLGCGPTLKFNSAGAARPPKPPTCDFALLTAPPDASYEQLGTIDIQYDNTGFLDKPELLKKKIQPQVCKAGGDAALGLANTYGTYVKATVFSSQPATAAAQPADVPDTSGSEEPTKGAPEL